MSNGSKSKAQAAFKKQKRGLKPWEVAYREKVEKSERLKALRLARDAAETETGDADEGKTTHAPPE